MVYVPRRRRTTRAAATLALAQAEARQGATRGQCSAAARRNDGYGARRVPSRRRAEELGTAHRRAMRE